LNYMLKALQTFELILRAPATYDTGTPRTYTINAPSSAQCASLTCPPPVDTEYIGTSARFE
jgi:hypothetical protein